MPEKPEKCSLLFQHFKLVIFSKALPTKHTSVLAWFSPHSAFSSSSELSHGTWSREQRHSPPSKWRATSCSLASTSWHIGTAQTVGLTLSSGTCVVVAASWAGPGWVGSSLQSPLGSLKAPAAPGRGVWLQVLNSQYPGPLVLRDLCQKSLGCNNRKSQTTTWLF